MPHQRAPHSQRACSKSFRGISSCSKWTDLAEDCLAWPEHFSTVSQIQIIDFSDARFEERARQKKLSEQSHRLPTRLEHNSMSDLHVSSVRHALSRDLLYFSLTRKCVCLCSHSVLFILKGWWMSYSSDTGGQYGRFGCFYLLCLSERLQLLWFDESPASLQQAVMLFYCHPVVAGAVKFFIKLSQSTKTCLCGAIHAAIEYSCHASVYTLKMQLHLRLAKFSTLGRYSAVTTTNTTMFVYFLLHLPLILSVRTNKITYKWNVKRT